MDRLPRGAPTKPKCGHGKVPPCDKCDDKSRMQALAEAAGTEGQGQKGSRPSTPKPQGQGSRPHTPQPQGQAAHPQGQAAHPQGQSAHPQGHGVHPQGQAAHPQGQAAHPQGQGSRPSTPQAAPKQGSRPSTPQPPAQPPAHPPAQQGSHPAPPPEIFTAMAPPVLPKPKPLTPLPIEMPRRRSRLSVSNGRLSVPRLSIHRQSLIMEPFFDDKPKKKSKVGAYIPAIMALGMLCFAYKFASSNEFFNLVHPKPLQSMYDYIVVGAGTSGGVLADRLTDNTDNMVLLVEAGGDPTNNPDIAIPILAENAWGSEYDWNYHTTPQTFCCRAHNDSSAVWPMGRGLGGSTNLNYMTYLRGSRHDYDEWAQNGAHGWAYKDVLPYFIKSEDNHNGGFVNTIFHGYGGRMTVADCERSPVSKIIKDAFDEVGVKKKDVNGRSQFGYSQVQATVRRGIRWGTFKAFLQRALVRDNLHLLKETPVQKVIFEGKKAVGVVVEYNGKQKIIKAKKEVILAAGTVGSAKLLMLSGVGPRSHLESLNIPVVADLPVGENLQDHVRTDGVEFFTPHYVSISVARADNLGTAVAYSLTGMGMKASPRFREGIAFVRTRYQPVNVKYPLIALSVVSNVGPYIAEHVNVNYKTWDFLHGKGPHRDGFTIYPTLLHPRSRGTVRLQSANYKDDPRINPNYLKDEADVKVLVEAYQYVRRLIKTEIMDAWDVVLDDRLLPACAEHGHYTDAYVECLLRHITLPGYAPVGTCKMGAQSDKTAVVDHNLKVRGLKNIRVIDASVFPNALSGDTYAAQVMMAEKASDMIQNKDSVKAIKEYFKHLIAVKHEKFKDDDVHHHATTDIDK